MTLINLQNKPRQFRICTKNINYICGLFMQKSLRIFLMFSFLLVFLSNTTGISIYLEHQNHPSVKTDTKKNKEPKKGFAISEDDQCQCALHMQMHTGLLPELPGIAFVTDTKNSTEIPQQNAGTYRCLIDFFSSRAPPYFS